MKEKDIRIVVIDGQGGGIGKAIIGKLKKELPAIAVRALGSNSAATANMVKAGATDGATGENAIILNVKDAHIIMGVVAVVMPHAMLGEITPAMAAAVGASRALKILVPMQRCGIQIAVPSDKTLQECIDYSVELARRRVQEQLLME